MRGRARIAAVAFTGILIASCFDEGTRWVDPHGEVPNPECAAGAMRCAFGKIQRCEGNETTAVWTDVDDCAAKGKLCVSSTYECKTCIPDGLACDGQVVKKCHSDGEGADELDTCDTTKGMACREGACKNLCQVAGIVRSNVGCEYWPVDLDNAMISATSNAAAQQFAVVVSNPEPDIAIKVQIFQDDGNPGDAPAPVEIASSVIAPYNLQVFKLGPREVDGSPPGEYNTGTHTALTRHAYKVVTDFPVVAYQFNPLDNVNVFSNDASLLKPREALTAEDGIITPLYVVAGWPQTIAATDNPNTNFNPLSPINLRAFLTIVGTKANTTVRVHPTTTVVAGGPVQQTSPGGVIQVGLSAYDVLNLETGDFNADFTGTLIEADAPIVVYSGSEASDAPHFDKLANRRCCADHLEDQLDPLRTAGKSFAIAHTPSRTTAVKAAGGDIEPAPEPDYVRFIAASTKGSIIKTSLPAPDDEIVLNYRGDFYEITAYGDFTAQASEAVLVSRVMGSQDAANVKRGLPGGDPSLIIMPPVEQFRDRYVILTPDKYAFDFVTIIAPYKSAVYFDDTAIEEIGCETAPADGLTDEERGRDPDYVVYRCQLGFPSIDPLKVAPDNLKPGMQNDGVHRVTADQPVGVLVLGFDSFVSYEYAGGTELRSINVPE